MRMGEYISKRKELFIITFFLIILIIIFSIYIFSKKGKESNNIQEQDLKVTYNITRDLLYPMNREDGSKNANTSSIVIKNNKAYDQNYKLIVKPDEGNTINFNKIYVMIDNNIYILSELKNNTIYQGTVKSNQEIVISFKTWVGLDLITDEDSDKVVNLKYEVIKE